MRILLLLAVLISTTMLFSCAEQGTTNEDGTPISTLEEGSPADADFIVDGEEPELNSLAGDTAVPMESDVAVIQDGAMMPTIDGEMAEYVVEKNDTLMLIAFNIYGDYSKWKDIQNMNPGIQATALKAGTVLKYIQPREKFVWNPQGNPYLIKTGDTLGLISSEVYTTPKRWREIYDNNRPMIKDPKLIFAGFTLYYIPDSKVASETF